MKLPAPGAGETPDHLSVTRPAAINRLALRCRVFIVALIFFTALGVRFINWQTNHDEALAVQTSVALNYKHQARLIQANGVASLYDASSSTNNPDLLGHPPGYPLMLSALYRVAGEHDTVTQFLQIILDSLSVVIIVLIAFEFFPAAIALIAGLLAAFAPQFSWNSLTLLPDSLATLPILLAMLIITRTSQRPNDPGRSSMLSLLIAGALIGVSVWLRANALLLAPFLCLPLLFINKRGARLRPALVLVCGVLLIITPLTARNAIVFGKFIPVSLGAGQTFVEGIADYNTDGSLGLPQTDVALIRSEAETSKRPDYANSLFTPDGTERDRARLARGFAVIRAHPFWFAGVMIRRAASMLRLERTPLRLAATSSSVSALMQWPLRIVQKLFITALFLPLILIGSGILIYRRQFQTLAFLLAVPCYYFCTQSALHTEYRYVLVIHYFLFVLAAVAVYTVACIARTRAR
ncbi:MAG TPA: glycosyltransferase family 39 protein [Pyrinomonadaceae bacterium]|nr:glycosyltransferase family 39 protein [Pyrinomonadaceae bacterium]